MKPSTLLVFLACTVLLAKAQEKIISGQPVVSASHFPWQVGVGYKNASGNYFCGGALIHSEWVLTAAHCTQNAISFNLHFGGLTLRSQEKGKKIWTSTEYIQHPEYNPNTKYNNIALIRLPQPIPLSDVIKPIDLPPDNYNIRENVSVTAAGWGSIGHSDSSVLNYANLETITNDECKKYYRRNVVFPSTLCAVGKQNENICSRDVGSPLIIYNISKPIVIAVASFTHPDGCSEKPSGFIRTTLFKQWILGEMEKNA